MFKFDKKISMPAKEQALPGRTSALSVSPLHYVNGNTIKAPFPAQVRQAMFGLGCFWGAERIFWNLNGVFSTAVGYAAGYTPNPTYEEVCTGMTGHNEVVLVMFEPEKIDYKELLKVFWQSHNPTQGMRQGNDRGTQYRSGIYTFDEIQHEQALLARTQYATALGAAGYEAITTEIVSTPEFYYAEDYHQQYLAKNPGGYCGLGGTGIGFPSQVCGSQ